MLDLETLLTEWHTGRDASGESARFAARWRDSVVAGMAARTYEAHVEDLQGPVAALATADGATGANVRLAVGADGQPDVRIELDYEPLVVDPVTGATSRAGKPDLRTQRWRPATGDLLDVRYRGASAREQGRARASFDHALARARALDLVTAELPDTGGALAVLKMRRAELLDMAEAGADVSVELVGTVNRSDEIRAEHDAMNLEHKLELLAQDAANIAEKLAVEADPEVTALLTARASQIDAITPALQSRLDVARPVAVERVP